LVSQVSFPVFGSATVGLGTASCSAGGFEEANCPPGPEQAVCLKAVEEGLNRGGGGLLVSFAAGAARQPRSTAT